MKPLLESKHNISTSVDPIELGLTRHAHADTGSSSDATTDNQPRVENRTFGYLHSCSSNTLNSVYASTKQPAITEANSNKNILLMPANHKISSDSHELEEFESSCGLVVLDILRRDLNKHLERLKLYSDYVNITSRNLNTCKEIVINNE